MPTETKLTGYPSIDKPWLKYYSEKIIDFDINKTLYNNFKIVAEQITDDLAIINYRKGKKTTFGDLLFEVEEFANSLVAVGIGTYDKVVALTFNSFIDPIILLGANKIGAVVEFLDPQADIKDSQRHLSNAKILFVEGVFLPLAKLICNNLPVVVYNSSKVVEDNNYMSYPQFIDMGKSFTALNYEDVTIPAIIIFSSGSTGAPKPIVHSNYSINCAIKKMLYSDFPLNNDNIMMKAIPSYIGLGVVTSLLVSLMAKMPYIQVSTVEEGLIDIETCAPDAIPILMVSESRDLLVNFENWQKVNKLNDKGLVIFAAPIFFKFFFSQEKAISNLSFVKGILLGGSKMSKQELEMMEKVFNNKGLSVPIGIGYGQNELCGAVALNTVNYNKNGSAGYPVFETSIKIVNRDTYEDLEYNQIGLILEQSDSKFLCYDNMPEETEKTKIILPDGTEWYNSNDLGYMDEDGFIFITGRTNRVVIKTDLKISMDVVETKIKEIDGVLDAAVVPYVNGNEIGDTIAFVVIDKLIRETFSTEDFTRAFSYAETPVKVIILNELPRMNNSKVDYRALEREAEKL